MHRSVKGALGAAVFGLALVPNLSPASAATFNAPVVVSSADVSEPGVEVAPDGTLYVHGPAGIPLWSTIWRSGNGGASWVQTSSLTRTGLGGGDIDLAIQANGKLAFTDLWLGASSVGSSSDKGNNWITNQVQGTMVQDRQWVETTSRDIVYHVTHQLAAGLVVAKSVDGGITYPVQSLAASTLDQGGCICPPGTMTVEAGVSATAGSDDKVGVVYSTSTGVKFARSVNGGLTWSQHTIDPQGGGSTIDSFPIVKNAGGGKLVAVWLDISGSTTRVMYSESLNWGVNWSSPRAIVSGGTSVFPWMDVKGSKVAVTLYHSSTAGNPSNLPSSAQWFVKYTESLDGGASFSSLVSADPTAVKSGPICVDGINCGEDRELGDFQMVALDANLSANISYVRSIDGKANTEVRFVKQAS